MFKSQKIKLIVSYNHCNHFTLTKLIKNSYILLIKKFHCYLKILLLQNIHLYQLLIKLINFVIIIIKLNIIFTVLMFSEHLLIHYNTTLN